MLDFKWKTLGELLYSQDTAVTAVKMAIILSLWGAARVLTHYYGEKPPPGMGLIEAVKRKKMRPTKRYLALPPARRSLIRKTEQTLYVALSILGLLFILTYLQIL